MAELLWRRWEVVTVVPSDVGADAAATTAALTPPLVTVSSQTGKSNKYTSIEQHYLTSVLYVRYCDCDCFTVFLPGLDVLRHDAPRQIIVAVITPWVVKEIRPGGEDVTRKPRTALQEERTNKTINIS